MIHEKRNARIQFRQLNIIVLLQSYRKGCQLVRVIFLLSILLLLSAREPSFAQAAAEPPLDPCEVKSITKLEDAGVKIWSPNGEQYLINKKDKNGDYQIYVGAKYDAEPICISCKDLPGGPIGKRNKMQVGWHPSGRWIVFAGERLFYNEIWLPKRLRQGWLECGIWMDIYAITSDGTRCFKLATPKGGFTGVAFTPDGKRGVWAEALGMAPKAIFGKWQLKLADFEEQDGQPRLTNVKDITPAGATWLEPGTFSPNGVDVSLNADIGLTDAQGQDQYILNVDTLNLRNLTNSPKQWDEHGVFSPDGAKLFLMSSFPYRDKPNSYKILGLKTDFMLINSDGSGLRQVTHFNTPGFPESYKEGVTPAVGVWNKDGTAIDALVLLGGSRFPDYDVWRIEFNGNCGCRSR